MKANPNKMMSEHEACQNENSTSGIRLRQILGVLKKHRITHGLQPQKLKEILEDLGPTYVKLGQIMSMRSDMLPENYCRELAKLRTEVKPMPYDTVVKAIEAELRKPVKEVFLQISPEPLGSASIAQVHPAVLLNGDKVVLKVQRPHIRETMAEDLSLMRKAVSLLKITIGTGDLIDFRTVIDELWKTSQEEMDFLMEAANCDLFAENQKEIAYVTCPAVNHELTTMHLLVMSNLEGVQIDQADKLTSLGYDMTEIGRKAAENYCKQILEDGFFHADPHPGNIRIADGKIAWLDLGMMGRLSNSFRELFRRAVLAVLKNDIYELKNVLLALGDAKGRINHTQLYTDIDDIVSKYVTTGFGNMDVGELIERLLELIKSHQIAISPDITLLGRSMITMEGLLSACSPDVNMFDILSAHMSAALFEDINLKKKLRHNARLAYSSLSKSLEIPALLTDLLNITKNGQTKVNLEFSNSQELENTFRNGMNHLVLSILFGALFMGSSLLCLTSITPTVFSLPWPSFVGFVISFLILFTIIWKILRKGKRS